MKKKQTLVCGFLAVMFVLSFGACSGGGQKLTGPTDSFKFVAINGETAYRVSAGTTVEGKVSIPAYYRPNADSNYLPVTEIGDEAFYACTSLTKVTIPKGVTSIGDFAFYECRSLASITIPKGVTSIGNSAFAGTSLTSITIPASVTEIGNYVFAGCTSLTSITIPASVTTIGQQVFYGWSASQTIKVPFANQEEADKAWGSGQWRGKSTMSGETAAKIVYQGR
jgi:hypothetical protein